MATIGTRTSPVRCRLQVTGLNDDGVTVGFWADANGDNFGFVEFNGHFINVFDPHAPKSAAGSPSVEQLLGINDKETAVGFYTDAQGNNHGFTYDLFNGRFEAVSVVTKSGVRSGWMRTPLRCSHVAW